MGSSPFSGCDPHFNPSRSRSVTVCMGLYLAFLALVVKEYLHSTYIVTIKLTQQILFSGIFDDLLQLGLKNLQSTMAWIPFLGAYPGKCTVRRAFSSASRSFFKRRNLSTLYDSLFPPFTIRNFFLTIPGYGEVSVFSSRRALFPNTLSGRAEIGTTIDINNDSSLPEELASVLAERKSIVALTGAGISVESGIPDFRSPGGLWKTFDPSVYATIDTFLANPSRSWELFRAVGEALKGKEPNEAHLVLSRLEAGGHLSAVITQNIDGLHKRAGSNYVIEVHGDHDNLECLECASLYPVEDRHLEGEEIPLCDHCGYPLKPNVVLFGEAVRHLDEAFEALRLCDTLFVLGTSAQVYPAASFPYMVKERGGLILVFDREDTPLTHSIMDYFFKGNASRSLPIVERLLTEA